LVIQRFTATVTTTGSATCIVLPFKPNQAWGVKERHHVTGSVNSHGIRGPLQVEDGRAFLVLGAAWRRGCGIEAGDKVEVTLAPEGPQMAALAPDITAALDAEPEAKAFFESLATFYRKGYLRWIDATTRRPDVRATRIAEMIELLKASKKAR
jgi:hypothetical protein